MKSSEDKFKVITDADWKIQLRLIRAVPNDIREKIKEIMKLHPQEAPYHERVSPVTTDDIDEVIKLIEVNLPKTAIILLKLLKERLL